jgi:hypothetical protein
MQLPSFGLAPLWHLSISFQDGNIRVGLVQWWLRLIASERAIREACQVESSRPDTLQFATPITP